MEHDLKEETKVDGQFKKIKNKFKKPRWTDSRRLGPSSSGSPTMLLKRWKINFNILLLKNKHRALGDWEGGAVGCGMQTASHLLLPQL